MVTSNPAPPPAPPDVNQLPGPGTYPTSYFTPLRFQGSATSYGWPAYGTARAPYNTLDVPSSGRAFDPYNTAYEWFKYGEKIAGGQFTTSNPPFSSDAAGRLMSTIQ